MSTSAIMSPSTHGFKQLLFFCVAIPTVLLLNVESFFLIRPSALFWISALLLVEKSIMFDCTSVYASLYMSSRFCSFHSASVPGDFSSSHRISPIHYSFQHSNIPSPAYTTICSAIPQLKGVSSFSNFLPPQRVRL